MKKPEEKAEELITKFIYILEDVGTVPSEVRKEAIRCSLLCVNEQLDLINLINNDGADDYYEDLLQVKEALEAF